MNLNDLIDEDFAAVGKFQQFGVRPRFVPTASASAHRVFSFKYSNGEIRKSRPYLGARSVLNAAFFI